MSSGRAWMLGLHEMSRMEDIRMNKIRNRHLQLMKAKKRFCEIFGVPLKKFYEHINIGFDVVGFDDYLMTQDEQYRKANNGELGEDANCSMADHIKTKYGEEAYEMLSEFIR